MPLVIMKYRLIEKITVIIKGCKYRNSLRGTKRAYVHKLKQTKNSTREKKSKYVGEVVIKLESRVQRLGCSLKTISIAEV